MLGAHQTVGEYLDRLQAEIARIDRPAVDRLADAVHQAWLDGTTVFIVGNGGSACTASHLAEDLGKNCLREEDMADDSRRRLRVMSLTDNVGWLTALGNDLGYDQIFVQQLMHFAQPGDLLIAISGSGNSANILAAGEWAKRHDVAVFGLTGFDGGKLAKLQTDGLRIDLDDMGMVESLHLCVAHWVIDDLHGRVNTVGRHAPADA